ncbi:hypothetical protein GCM10009797_31540 [Nocardioides hwasunensis]
MSREFLLQEIIDKDKLSEIRGGSWIDDLRTWYYRYGPKCGSAGLTGIGTTAWMGRMTAYAIDHSNPTPPRQPCGTCVCQ